MARINVEEHFWTDPRLERLSIKLRSRRNAIGHCIDLWRIGQEFYSNGNKFTLRAFKYHKLSKYLIECGFAVLENDEIKVRGADCHFKWLKEAKAVGKTGGRPLSENTPRTHREHTVMFGRTEFPNKNNEVTKPSSSSSSSSSNNIINKKVEYTSEGSFFRLKFPENMGNKRFR